MTKEERHAAAEKLVADAAQQVSTDLRRRGHLLQERDYYGGDRNFMVLGSDVRVCVTTHHRRTPYHEPPLRVRIVVSGGHGSAFVDTRSFRIADKNFPALKTGGFNWDKIAADVAERIARYVRGQKESALAVDGLAASKEMVRRLEPALLAAEPLCRLENTKLGRVRLIADLTEDQARAVLQLLAQEPPA